MLPATDDTIAAVASPHGGAARGIVRISGPDTLDLCQEFFTPDDWPGDWPGPDLSARRYAGTWRIGTAADLSRQLPVDLHLWPNRNSYTGQPSAEIHMIGSPPVLQKLLEELLAHETPGVRVARPGEFTLRSFLAGRIDLVQAEAVLGVIEAEDHVGLEVALRQLAGGLSGPLGQLRSQLVGLLSDLEAGLDFADEDIEFISARQRTDRLEALAQALATIRQQAGQRMTSGERHQVVFAG
ncbi:MAG: tRNA uridine-5-carboxymethylaminomethyl(34) synthesis GTPase MnmE, partial [Planctomycetota bacterium]|nr:tRNA uridine-5-carboxymethylaminomethyl(34) synthesis GTPase MnmE [Planctomycetota bacterium]